LTHDLAFACRVCARIGSRIEAWREFNLRFLTDTIDEARHQGLEASLSSDSGDHVNAIAADVFLSGIYIAMYLTRWPDASVASLSSQEAAITGTAPHRHFQADSVRVCGRTSWPPSPSLRSRPLVHSAAPRGSIAILDWIPWDQLEGYFGPGHWKPVRRFTIKYGHLEAHRRRHGQGGNNYTIAQYERRSTTTSALGFRIAQGLQRLSR
jgi:hypothetical protein